MSAWLQQHRSAPREQAATFSTLGDKARRAGRWGAASKSFGESALLYPAPDTLSAYGQALLHERAAVRGASGAPLAQQQGDWREASAIFATALAADDQVHTLKPAERKAIADDATCLAEAAKGGPAPASCAALRLYQAALRAPTR
ncbi:hypothetical protein [Aquabacterium sp.]|uniref:hypothetical protein n=1 Tax=Aquabacterium sp. TaxID=1872578 RepID=UPI002C0A8718|nr:hypothetical protein [Aquabacterium sp.]HSW04168.1 hypothetical protein [Aquabacterium sp.]